MSGFFARVSARAFGLGTELRPVTNRYVVARPHDDGLFTPSTFAGEEDGIARAPSIELTHVRTGSSRRQAASPVSESTIHDRHERLDVPREATRVEATRERSERMREPVVEPRVDEPVLERQDELHSVSVIREREFRLMPVAQSVRNNAPQKSINASVNHESVDSSIVHVHIGRIDVRAIQAAPAKPIPPRATMPTPSLEEHLRARDKGCV